MKVKISNITPKTFQTDHIHRLTNSVGIFQHAKFASPNFHHGYCLDDNVRSLQLLILAANKNLLKNEDHQLIDTYIAYIYYMQNDDGSFRNFLSFQNTYLDERSCHDAFDLTIYALGITMQLTTNKHVFSIAKEIMDKAYDIIDNLTSIRAVSYALCGLNACYSAQNYDKPLKQTINKLADFIVNEYNNNKHQYWKWFEKIITYDNAIIPYALILANEINENNNWKQIIIDSTIFLDGILFKENHLELIGNDGWFTPDCKSTNTGQQPIEIPALILLYNKINASYTHITCKGSAHKCYDWFFGLNSTASILFDIETKGCSDGLDGDVINLNQGAESTISFWQSFIYVQSAF